MGDTGVRWLHFTPSCYGRRTSSAAKKLDFAAPTATEAPIGQAFLRGREAREQSRTAADVLPELFEYFANPTPEMLAAEAAVGAAYEQGRALHGEEDGDAWLAALEDGTHPLCRVKTAA